MFAAMDDVTGKAAEAEREFPPEVKESAYEDEEATKEEEGAADFAEEIHKKSLEQTQEVRKSQISKAAAMGGEDGRAESISQDWGAERWCAPTRRPMRFQ